MVFGGVDCGCVAGEEGFFGTAVGSAACSVMAAISGVGVVIVTGGVVVGADGLWVCGVCGLALVEHGLDGIELVPEGI